MIDKSVVRQLHNITWQCLVSYSMRRTLHSTLKTVIFEKIFPANGSAGNWRTKYRSGFTEQVFIVIIKPT